MTDTHHYVTAASTRMKNQDMLTSAIDLLTGLVEDINHGNIDGIPPNYTAVITSHSINMIHDEVLVTVIYRVMKDYHQ